MKIPPSIIKENEKPLNKRRKKKKEKLMKNIL